MKRTSKVISMMLAAFMLMQMMTGVAFAKISETLLTDVPTKLKWEENEFCTSILFDRVKNAEVYLIEFYKDGKLIDTTTDEISPDYNNDVEIGDFLMSSAQGTPEYNQTDKKDIFTENGNGTYKFRVGVCVDTFAEFNEHWDPDRVTVAKWSDFSPELKFTKTETNDFSIPNVTEIKGKTEIEIKNIYKTIPYKYIKDIKFASSLYENDIKKNTVFTYTNKESGQISKAVSSSTPLIYNDDKSFGLKIEIPDGLEIGSYNVEMLLPIADKEEAADIKPFKISIDKFDIIAPVAAPTNVHWGTEAEGALPSEVVFDWTVAMKAYKYFIYKDGELVDCSLIPDSAGTQVYFPKKWDFANTIRRFGAGDYTVKVGVVGGETKDYSKYEKEDVPVLAESEMSEAFRYELPKDKYPDPELKKVRSLIKCIYDAPYDSEFISTEYALYKNGTMMTVQCTISHKAGTYSINSYDYQNMVNELYKSSPETYDKKGVRPVVGVQIRPKNILLAQPSDEVFIFEDGTIYVPGEEPVQKYKITYKVSGEVFATAEVQAGTKIPALDKIPVKEGYAFDGWENLPEIMPDKDITVNAKFVVEPPVVAGTFSANYKAKWSLSKDGTLYISGTGSASVAVGTDDKHPCLVLEYMSDRAKVETIKKVVVGEGITELGDDVLYELYNAEEITLPSTLKKIGGGFMKGSLVRDVVIPANVDTFNMNWSFIKCPSELKITFLNKDIELTNNLTFGNSTDLPSGLNLYGYTDSDVETYANSDEHKCNFTSIDPDFLVNSGADETTDKNVKISFNDYAKNDFRQYKINDGEYKNIDGNDIDFVLDSAYGEKTICITFKNDNCEIEKTQKIIFNNKHKITYVSGDTIIDEATVGCGAKIAATDKTASKEGYTFIKWDVPETMPDSDVTANAIFAKNADSEQLDAILSDEEKADGISVKAEIAAAEENENIQAELINKYSKYTASILLEIEISKIKENDDSFTPIKVSETENLLTFTIDIPSEIQGKAEYIVLREHNGAVDALTTSKNADGEYIEVKDNTIIIHAKKFSAYQLIAKDADPTPSRSGGGGGGSSSLTVKFETNGALAIKSLSVNRNSVITAPTVPVKDGFVFDGWYTDKNFANKFDFNTKITKSITLYAKWVEKAKTSIILTIGQKDATIDGKTVSNDVAPKIVNDRTMLPIRFIAEALGAKVDWIEESRAVKITAENIDISLVIGEDFATVNGEKIDLDSPSFIENDRTYLPIRFVSEKLGADVKWDDATQTVNITK